MKPQNMGRLSFIVLLSAVILIATFRIPTSTYAQPHIPTTQSVNCSTSNTIRFFTDEQKGGGAGVETCYQGTGIFHPKQSSTKFFESDSWSGYFEDSNGEGYYFCDNDSFSVGNLIITYIYR